MALERNIDNVPSLCLIHVISAMRCVLLKSICAAHYNFLILSEAFVLCFFSDCWILCVLWVQCFYPWSGVKTVMSCKQLQSASLCLL